MTSLAGGLAGALTVALLHGLARKIAPAAARSGTIGEQAAAQLAGSVEDRRGPYKAALAGDIVGNTLYYSLAGAKINKAMSTGGLLGLGAGLSALQLPALLGQRTHASSGQRWLTIGLYVAGGLMAAGVTKWLEKKAASRRQVGAPAYSPQEAYKPVLDITV